MGRIPGGQGRRDLCLGLCLGLFALALLRWPAQTGQAVKDAMLLCLNVILPSLFPFFVLASLVVELGMSRYLGKLLQPVMAPLFRVNGACAAALALGFVGGYPVGARTAVQLYRSGQCSREEAQRLLAFCNNCGPAFILGAVGTGMFGSGTAGLVLYFAHLTASILVGLLFRFHGRSAPSPPRLRETEFEAVPFCTVFPRAVTGSIQSLLNICSFVLFFSVVVRILTLSGAAEIAAEVLSHLLAPIGVTKEGGKQLLTGLLELSSGVSTLTDGPLTGRLSMAAFMLGWAGLSVHCQVLAFVRESGLSMDTYLAGKLLHGIVSAGLIRLLARIRPEGLDVSLSLAQQTEGIACLDFQRALTLSAAAAWWVWLAFFVLTLFAIQKSGGKRAGHGV